MKSTIEKTGAQDNSSYLGKAAGRKRIQIISKVLESNSRSFFKNVQFHENSIGLDLMCGIGTTTIQLAEFIGPYNKVSGFDSDVVNIGRAHENAKSKSEQLNFHLLDEDNWLDEEAYDFIHFQTFFNSSYPFKALFQKIYSGLNEGGFLLLQHFDNTNFQCFPQNYAFERSLELHTELELSLGIRIDSVDQLKTLLYQSQFQKVQIQQISPSFLKAEDKQLVSLSLEHISTMLMERKLASHSELHALMNELKNFESQKNTMISLPGMYQVIAFK